MGHVNLFQLAVACVKLQQVRLAADVDRADRVHVKVQVVEYGCLRQVDAGNLVVPQSHLLTKLAVAFKVKSEHLTLDSHCRHCCRLVGRCSRYAVDTHIVLAAHLILLA